MPFNVRRFTLAAVSESQRQLLLGPFRQGRVVRGLHFTVRRTAGAADFVALAACAVTDPVPVPPTSSLAFDALENQFFNGFTGYVNPIYLRLPVDQDVYLPLQVEFRISGWILASVLNFAGTAAFEGSLCSACGLGSVRSGKRRGRTVSQVG